MGTPTQIKRNRKKSEIHKSKKLKKHNLKKKSTSKNEPKTFTTLMENIDAYSDVISEFENYLRKNQTDPYLNFYRQVTILEQGNLEEAKIKKLCISIMNQYLGMGDSTPLLSVEPLFLNEISAKKDNPNPQMFKPIKDEILSLLEQQYINFITSGK